MRRRPIIALLTDFGTRDWYVAAIRGVLLARCPDAQLVDITHEVPPQDIIAGAFTLAAAAPWLPAGTVCAAVVDPGVGSDRALLAAAADGRYVVGPDNGLLWLAVSQARRARIVRLTNRRCWLPTISHTFQGRDIIAPVAAALANGSPLARLGVPIRQITPLNFPAPQWRGQTLVGQIIHLDVFGNLITNLPASRLQRPRMVPAVRYQRRTARVVSSYREGSPQELIALANSQGLVELAVREGSAAWTFNAKRGDRVKISLREIPDQPTAQIQKT